MEEIIIDAKEVLQALVSRGILAEADMVRYVMDKKREEIVKQHEELHKIWERDGKFFTYIRDDRGKLVIRKRRTMKELADYLIDYYAHYEQVVYLPEICKEYLDAKRSYGEIQPQSYDRYMTAMRQMLPESAALCRIPVSRITALDIEDHIRLTVSEQHLTHKSYSTMVTLLRGAFKRARKKGLTSLSITQVLGDVEIPKNAFRVPERNSEKEVFHEDEIPIVKKYLKENADIWNLGLILQFQTGLRVGELAALKWEDIDEHCIHVRRTECKYRDESGKWKAHIAEHAKTDAGRRDVMLPQQAQDTIREIRRINPFGEFLFMNRGHRIRENTFNKRLDLVCEACGIPHRSTHKIRKTYGTALLDARVEDSIVAEQMGHKDVTTTRKLYYYCNKSNQTKLSQISAAIDF